MLSNAVLILPCLALNRATGGLLAEEIRILVVFFLALFEYQGFFSFGSQCPCTCKIIGSMVCEVLL